MKNFSCKLLLVCAGIFMFLQSSKADDKWDTDAYYPVYNLSADWQVYDENYGAYVPYIDARHKNSKTMSVWLDLRAHAGYKLVFYAQKDLYLMINNGLSRQIFEEGWVEMDIDSMGTLYADEMVFCTFYAKQPVLPLPRLFIGFPKLSAAKPQDVPERQVQYPPKARKLLTFRYFITIQLLVLAVFYTTTFNYFPRAMRGYYNLRSSLSRMSRIDPNLIHKTFSGNTLWVLGGHALLVALVYEMLLSSAKEFAPGYSLFVGYSGYAQKLILVLLWVVFKYALTASLGLVLSVDKGVSQVHFFEYFRLSMLFYTVLAFLMVFLSISFPSANIYPAVAWGVLIFHTVQAFLVSFYVLKQIRHTSLYLFYYLCITEFIPLMVGIKFLLFSDLLTQNILFSVLYE